MRMGKSKENIWRKIGEIKEYRKQFYDKRAEVYDEHQFSDEAFFEEMKGFKNLVKVRKDDLILDIATGTGIYLIQAAQNGASCYGLDISKKMIKKLKDKAEKQGLKNVVKGVCVGEASGLPYCDSFFDWVTCVGMLDYYPIEYAEIVLKEIRRVLKPVGKCFIDIADPHNPQVQNEDYVYKYDLQSFEAIIQKTGFKISARNVAGKVIQFLLKTEAEQ